MPTTSKIDYFETSKVYSSWSPFLHMQGASHSGHSIKTSPSQYQQGEQNWNLRSLDVDNQKTQQLESDAATDHRGNLIWKMHQWNSIQSQLIEQFHSFALVY